MTRILYPVLTEPVLPPTLVKEEIHPDAWAQPLSVPVRRDREQPQAVRASGSFFVKAALFPEATTVDRYHQPLSRPVIMRRDLPTSEIPYLSFVKAAPFAETVSADRWVQPLSQPFFPIGLAVREQPYFAFVKAAPFGEAVTADRWVQPLSQPTARLSAQQPAAAFVYAPTGAVETVTLDKWLQPLSIPGRQLRALQFPALSYSYASVSAAQTTTIYFRGMMVNVGSLMPEQIH